MTTTVRKQILRPNALYLLTASIDGLLTDMAGAFFARGPESQFLPFSRSRRSASSKHMGWR